MKDFFKKLLSGQKISITWTWKFSWNGFDVTKEHVQEKRAVPRDGGGI